MIKVLPLPTMMSNRYLVLSLDGYLLIDTGLQMYEKQLMRQLQIHQAVETALKKIIITHADGDHYGALACLQGFNGHFTICSASEPEADAIRSGRMSRELKISRMARWIFKLTNLIFSTTPARIDNIIMDGMELPEFELKVISTPGHTPGHISLWSEQQGILFCGDSILIHGRKLIPSSGFNNWNEKLSIESFEKQIALRPEVIYGGHGIWKRSL